MNKPRRNRIARLLESLRSLHSELEEIQSEEREYYDTMPESFQSGAKGEAADTVATNLENAASDLDDLITNLESLEE